MVIIMVPGAEGLYGVAVLVAGCKAAGLGFAISAATAIEVTQHVIRSTKEMIEKFDLVCIRIT
jgi:hypothetical protein